ncbi:MAG: efflux RND transporter permease subunit [Candidatus Omnitrophica bacterium]|nr:efflux RND transporter permease subunit [Candidatus Omnitrophota bacterium]
MNIISLPYIAVHRPITTSMVYLAIALIGLITLQLLPVEMMPNISFGDITISIDVRGGIPASEIETRVSKIVEEAVGTVSNLKNILTISKEGNSTTILEFHPGTNMDFAALEVREKFNRIRNKLPSEIEKPIIAKYEYMDVPILILAVTSDRRPPEELRKIVDEKIKDRIQRIEGVARVEVAGGREGKILVEIDQYKLQSFGLSINYVVDTINANNANLLAGDIKRTKDKYLVRTIGEFENLEDIENLAIATTKQGSVIRVKDIAKVKDSYLEPVAFARLNLEQVVTLYIQKESMGNTVKISRLINREIDNLKRILDKDIRITATFNQAEAIKQAVDQVKQSLFYGANLATIILLLFSWDIRLVSIIALTIPLSILLTFSLMFFSKLTINVMTLSGLALGVGMLVDCSIVVLDNVFKKRDAAVKRGFKAEEAFKIQTESAILGAQEMFLALLASTFTTIIVFFPLFFINPEIRMLYSGVALTITFSLLASLFSSVTLTPMLLSRLRLSTPPAAEVTSSTQTAEQDSISELPTPEKKRLTIAEILANFYKGLISVILTLRYLVLLGCIALAIKAFNEAKLLEKEFIAPAEQNKFTIFIEMPTGTKLEVSDAIVKKVEEIVTKVPEVKTATAKIEPWSSKIYVELLPLSKRQRTTQEIIESIRPHTDKLDPAFIYFEEPEEIGTKEIFVELYGYDYEILKSKAIEIAQRIQAIPSDKLGRHFSDTKIRMREGRPEMHLLINKREAALFGLSVENIALALHTHMRGLVATHYRGLRSGPMLKVKDESFKNEDKFLPDEMRKTIERRSRLKANQDITSEEAETIVRLQEKYRRTFDDMRKITLVTPDGQQVFLSQVADFKYDIGPSEIWRKNKSRMVQVSANIGGMALGTAAERVKDAIKDVKFPKDYFWQFGGNYDKMIRNEKELRFALVLSILLVYMILAALFESFSQPFIILGTVPLAFIGTVFALRITNTAVGMGVLIGAIMLGGIVVNNAIVLIDRINFLRHSLGYDYGTAKQERSVILEASLDRLRPIMMTSLTTILGLIPMALDKSESANLWAPLAITVIGGMSVATVLTLFVIPCIYLIFKDFRLIRK